jgi:transposase InsO family protein
LIDRVPLPTRAEAKREVFDFIEGWYNPHRRHPALGYDSADLRTAAPSLPRGVRAARVSTKPQLQGTVGPTLVPG